MKTRGVYSNIQIFITHMLMGFFIFYFLVHPFTMVVYWFEFSNTPFTFLLFFKIAGHRLIESFSFHMFGMSFAMSAVGILMGIGSGAYWVNLQNSRKLINKQYMQLNRDVSKLIESGENEWLEFKSSIRYDYKLQSVNSQLEKVIAKTIAGFMNTRGGKLIIGVSDAGEVIGLCKDYNTLKDKNRDGFERKLYEIISTYIGQQFCFKNHVHFYTINKKEICVVDVEELPEPVYLNGDAATTFFVRTGNATLPLSVKEAVEYIQLRKKKYNVH